MRRSHKNIQRKKKTNIQRPLHRKHAAVEDWKGSSLLESYTKSFCVIFLNLENVLCVAKKA